METIRELIEKAAEKTPKKTLFILNDHEIAYEDFLLAVKRVANGFLSLGVRKGDRVAILLHNCVQFPYAWLAANMIGAVMVPVNARFVDKEALHVLNHSEAKVLATSEAHLGMIGNIRNQLPALETIISIDGPSENVLYFGDLLEASPDLGQVAIDGHRDLAAILYTSGTTGTPKGCMATHDYYVNLAYMQADLFGLSSEDRVYTAQPFYYMDPQWNTLMAMTCNATVVVSEKFSTGRFWDEIRRRDITCFYCIGSMTSFLYNMPPSPSIRSTGSAWSRLRESPPVSIRHGRKDLMSRCTRSTHPPKRRSTLRRLSGPTARRGPPASAGLSGTGRQGSSTTTIWRRPGARWER